MVRRRGLIRPTHEIQGPPRNRGLTEASHTTQVPRKLTGSSPELFQTSVKLDFYSPLPALKLFCRQSG